MCADAFFCSRRKHIITLVLLLITALLLSACSGAGTKVYAEDLMEGIVPASVEGKETDEEFISQMADFALRIFKGSAGKTVNSLVSPLSVMLALSMTANGAAGKTLDEMTQVLGGELSIAEMNKYLYTYVSRLPSSETAKLRIANSIWFRGDEGRFIPEQDFLQTNADYYMADAYKAAFDDSTLDDINNWVESNTDGMIDKILDQINEDTVMYLINAIVFDAKWEKVYSKNDIINADFRAFDGSVQSAELMISEESMYLEGSGATGFLKPYDGGDYSFAAILPDEGVSLDDFLNAFDGSKLLEILATAGNVPVTAYTPKFSYDFKVKMNDPLKVMGITDAFDPGRADLSKLGRSTVGNLYIGEVLHKTFIAVDELGTKAGAVTKVEVNDESYTETKPVRLDKPFLYAIIDNATNLPIFIGTVLSLE